MNKPLVIGLPPSKIPRKDLRAFAELVRSGNEVSDDVLERNIENAHYLVIGRDGPVLVGVAALKNPQDSYRRSVERRTGIPLPASEFAFELGYVFVVPDKRKCNVGKMLCVQAMVGAEDRGVFATVRSSNEGMQRILGELRFSAAGHAYPSTRGSHSLQLYVRAA